MGRKFLRDTSSSEREGFRDPEAPEITGVERNQVSGNDWDLLWAARQRLEPLMLAALKDYTPQVNQSHIDTALWNGYSAVARILECEMRRIVEVSACVMRMAAFPLSCLDKRLRTMMEEDWFAVQARFHEKAFGELELPQRFGFHKSHGLLDYEPVTVGHDQYGYRCYIGDWSRQIYYQKPRLIV
jgi:hypothetical protein